MKNFLINKCMSYINKNTDYDKIKLAEIKYGLESIYLTFSKIIVISILATIFGGKWKGLYKNVKAVNEKTNKLIELIEWMAGVLMSAIMKYA